MGDEISFGVPIKLKWTIVLTALEAVRSARAQAAQMTVGCVRRATLSNLSTCRESKLLCEVCISHSWKTCQQVPGLPANKSLLALQQNQE